MEIHCTNKNENPSERQGFVHSAAFLPHTRYFLKFVINAMVTRQSSTGTVRRLFHQNRTILRRPYGARPAAWRIVQFFYQFLNIVRCPVKFRYYLKFHGARTAFGRANEGKMTSAGHRTVPGRRLYTSDGHRTIFV